MDEPETQTEGEPPEVNPEVAMVATPTPAEGQAPEEEEFDRGRALATIRKLREGERQAQKDRRELEQLRQAKRQAEEVQLSEQERLSRRTAELEQQLIQERMGGQERAARYEVQLAAAGLDVIDPEAVVKLLDWSVIEYDDKGQPLGVREALTSLLEEKPYLVRTAAAAVSRVSPTNPARPPSGGGARVYHAHEIQNTAFYRANRDDIMLALREGRITDD